MVSERQIAVITSIESDKKDINSVNKISTNYYEKEALRCFKRWRKSAGWLKDIKIYCFCLTDALPTQKTLSDLKELNVVFIHRPLDCVKNKPNGFFSIPYLLNQAKDLEEEYFIKLDLDLEIYRPIPKDLFIKNKVIIPYYDKIDAKLPLNNFQDTKFGDMIDTGFIIYHKSSMFPRLFINEIEQILIDFNNNKIKELYNIDVSLEGSDTFMDIGCLEEFAATLVVHKNPEMFCKIKEYCLGPAYKSNPHNTNYLYFLHYHIPIVDIKNYITNRQIIGGLYQDE